MYEPAFAAAGSGVGGAAGAVPGVLGRSPLLDLLKPLDYPRQALWNLVRGPARLAQGEGSLDDILGMVPGLAGAGLAALGPLGLLGGALAGGAVQGLGKLTGSPAFEASTPQDVTGSEDFLPNLAVGAATDPLTYAGIGLGGHAGREIGKDLSVVPGGLEGFGREGALGRLSEQPAMQSLLDQAAQQLGPKQYARLIQGAPGMGGGAGRESLEAAAQAGLASRNQSLGEAVGEVARTRQGGLAQQATPPLPLAGPVGEASLSPEQAFEQMLPDYQKLQRAEAAFASPRNQRGPALEGMHPLDLYRRGQSGPVRELIGQDLGGVPLDEAAATNLRRFSAVNRARSDAGRALAERWGPLAAELQKTGQLGPIESRLQANWGMLGDQISEGTLRQADLLSGIERNLGEDEAFQAMFERGNAGMPGGPAAWGGQQAALNQLLEGLGQAHPGLAGEPARDIASMLSGAAEPGTARFLGQSPRSVPLTQFGDRPVTAEQQLMARQAELLEGNLNTAARHFALEKPETGALYRQIADANGPVPQNFWEPAAGTAPPSTLLPSGPAFPGEFDPGPAFPSLPEALAEHGRNVGRASQGWEARELEQALAQRNPQPFQERGLLAGEAPRDVNPPLPRGFDLEVHTVVPGTDLQQFARLVEELDQAGTFRGTASPASATGMLRIEKALGRRLYEAEGAWLGRAFS